MLDNTRVDLSQTRMENAKEDLATAAENMRAGRFRAANNRAYYAIYHAINAVLAIDSADAKSSGRAIEYFNENYLNSNLLDNYLKIVIDYAAETRNRCDYEDYYASTQEETKRNVSGAGDVLLAADNYIESRLKKESIQSAQYTEN